MAAFKKVTQNDVYVTCPTCSWEILLSCNARPPGEISVSCSNCGHRSIYQAADAHDQNASAGPIMSRRQIEFSTQNLTAAPPKSWLDQWLSSL
jgi:DNA-directed RNA polymerase subunit RPC12/RpoP